MPVQHDFLNYESWPSSLKIINPTEKYVWVRLMESLNVKAGATIRVEIDAKQKDVTRLWSGFRADAWNGRDWVQAAGGYIGFPEGSFDWRKIEVEVTLPSDALYVKPTIYGGGGVPEGVTWFDDLKIYQDDVLIYENKFSNWASFIVIPASILAGLGVVRFGKKG